MGRYIARRLVAALPVMLSVALLVFSLLYLVPGDPAAVIAGDQASPEDVARIRAGLGLDQSFMIRFATWLYGLIHGDLGTSIFTGRPVLAILVQRLEPTLSLMVTTVVVSLTLAVPLGVVAAWQRGGWLDRVILGMTVFGFSMPVFLIGYLLAWLFALQLAWLPVQGYAPIGDGLRPWLASLVLPSITLSGAYGALITRLTRATMLEVLNQDYVRTARAKGMGPGTVLFVHALKNAAGPIVTITGVGVALLIGGVVVTESVFALPGIGRLIVDAILERDYPVIQAVVLVSSLAVVLVNLGVDVLCALLDPRIRC